MCGRSAHPALGGPPFKGDTVAAGNPCRVIRPRIEP